MNPFVAIYSDGEILVPTLQEVDSLYNDGYGSRVKGDLLLLDPIETLYLVDRNKIIVIDEEKREKYVFRELLLLFGVGISNIWTNFMVYRDLRTRGYVVKRGKKLEDSLLLWDRGEYLKKPPAYLVYIISEGAPRYIYRINNIVENAEEFDQLLQLAVVDRRGEVVYYTVREKELLKPD
jgi:tRNA-intron endonuclease